jgi:hypothetical protein
MPENPFTNSTAGKWLGRLLLGAVLSVVWLELHSCADSVKAETRCESRPGIGNTVVTSCHEAGSGAPPTQYRTRPAVGGGTITTGGGRICTTREGAGGRMVRSCR